MKVATPGLDKSLEFHAIHYVVLLPKNVFPIRPSRRAGMRIKLSNGKTVKVPVGFHSGESVTDLGKSIKRDITNCVKVARMVFDCR